MKISFHGAARSVTGSRHVVQSGGTRVLLDCGLFQGRRQEADRKNRTLGFEAKSVDAVLLSHAHIDHSGALPALAKQGFSGKVYLTRATGDLADVMLEDSVRIQESDCAYVNKRSGGGGKPAADLTMTPTTCEPSPDDSPASATTMSFPCGPD